MEPTKPNPGATVAIEPTPPNPGVTAKFIDQVRRLLDDAEVLADVPGFAASMTPDQLDQIRSLQRALAVFTAA